MHDKLFERQFDLFLQKQKAEASPRRREMLEKDLTGTIKLFKEALWPVFKSFEGFVLEYEIKGPGGISIFLDVFYCPYRSSFECEGYSAHAETITRSRFDFEKQRIRTMLLHGITYIPFSWDELEKKGHLCRAFVQEMVAKFTSREQHELNIYEKEIIRAFAVSRQSFKIDEVCGLIQKKTTFSRLVVKSLIEKGLIRPARPTLKRHHEFLVEETALFYLQ
ncbi:hypothetical protein D3P08_07340 [Paenibacillus nanensis]|uniref:Uncharacterized protein n=1 Tax=Paenibacillus nanensis TaxID=393251 RepID=A0A3A1UZY2_9BACL|nr:hypothetical protein [Paenibacillus nanensis]RIX54058.1 hypothetical protein D3P08_07340 [Paenibacillus nanensis]